jgi:hypothetical protein
MAHCGFSHGVLQTLAEVGKVGALFKLGLLADGGLSELSDLSNEEALYTIAENPTQKMEWPSTDWASSIT